MKKARVRRLHEANPLREMDLSFWLQDWTDPYNVGGMFRVADACGARELFMTGRSAVPPHPQIGVTSMGAHRRIPYRHIQRNDDAARLIREAGYMLIAVEIADEAVPYYDFDFPDRTCLVLGSEGAGMYGNVLQACAAAVYIPMAGKGRSLNVHVSAAIVAFEARRPRELSDSVLT